MAEIYKLKDKDKYITNYIKLMHYFQCILASERKKM